MNAQNQNPNQSPAFKLGSDHSDATRPSGPTDQKLIVLSTFENSVEAHMFRNELESHGIEARVGNENTTATLGLRAGSQSSAFWIEVLIMESDAEKGLEIKRAWQESDQNDVESIPEWNCSCGETVDSGFGMCWNCDAEYQSPKND